ERYPPSQLLAAFKDLEARHNALLQQCQSEKQSQAPSSQNSGKSFSTHDAILIEDDGSDGAVSTLGKDELRILKAERRTVVDECLKWRRMYNSALAECNKLIEENERLIGAQPLGMANPSAFENVTSRRNP